MFQSFSFVLLVLAICFSIQSLETTMPSAKFFYFAYGSNLLSKRILINNPTAVRKGVAKLPGYRLDFNGYAQRWGGAVASIVPDERRHVWGALWEMSLSDKVNLDRQEGVASGIYEPFMADVQTPQGNVEARTYQYIKDPLPPMPSNGTADLGVVWRDLPMERRPSPEYRRVIIIGAIETGLPTDYIDALEMIPHNDYRGSSGLGVIPPEEFYRSGAPVVMP